MLTIVDRLAFPCICLLLGLCSIVFKGGGYGLAAGLLFLLMGLLYLASARFRMLIRTYGQPVDPKDAFIVNRSEILGRLQAMISNSGAIDSEQFGKKSFQSPVEFSICHGVSTALIPISLLPRTDPAEDNLSLESGWGIAYFCPATDTWKAMPFFHFEKQVVVDAFRDSLDSILELSLNELK